METPTRGGEFEVTGVSRSGRVRKKSSKLLDFQSLDDIEPIAKRTPKSSKLKPKSEDEDDSDISGNLSDSNSENDSDGMTDIVDEDETVQDPKYRPSLYLSEKANKKKISKDGKAAMGKAYQKDKGQARFTAYSLWARDIRKSTIFNKNGEMDFTNTAKRLGEMWANVPGTEKALWKRRAKRLSLRLKNDLPLTANETIAFANSPDKPSTSAAAAAAATTSSFINRPTTSRTRKLAQLTADGKSKTATAPTTPVKRTRRETATAAGAAGISNTPTSSASSTNHSMTSDEFHVTGHEPLDVAAHLKLLGDSLSIIGARLKEHTGPIAVSGSLAVLLDSLLCSLGPLMCLTTQIPHFQKRNALHDKLQSTLDNIAFIMPGLYDKEDI